GRKTRTIPASLRRALQHRDRGCRFPACTNHRFVDAHHVQHWVDGGETSLANTLLLCRRHHVLVHEHGFSVQCDPEPRFFDPFGAPVPYYPPALRPGADNIVEPTPTEAANEPLGDGEPIDYDA